MKPSDYYFCLHDDIDIVDDVAGYPKYKVLITFAPMLYWKEHKCLPDFYFADKVKQFQPEEQEYVEVIFTEECYWASTKLIDEVRKDLLSIGFVENKQMEKFLTGCWK